MDTFVLIVVAFLTVSLNLTFFEIGGLLSFQCEKNKKDYSLWKYWPISIWLITWKALWTEPNAYRYKRN